MAFNFHKGPQKIDDIISQLDTNGDTKIDLGDNQINIDVSGSTLFSLKSKIAELTGSLTIIPSASGTGQAILVSGSNTVGGSTYIDFIKATNTSAGAVTPSKSFRLNNSGTFEIINSDYSQNIYSLDDSGNQSIFGALSVGGLSVIGTTSEKLTVSSAASGTTTFDTKTNSIFYNSGPTGNITANFTNVPTNTDRTTAVTIIVSQSATPRTVIALQINGTGSTINWSNKVIPTANANQYDIFGFSLIRSGSTWITLGQMSTYG